MVTIQSHPALEMNQILAALHPQDYPNLAEFTRGGPLQAMLLRSIHSLLLQISQAALCSRFHTVEQRLCRWLLMAHDRAASEVLMITHEQLSHMVGASRRLA